MENETKIKPYERFPSTCTYPILRNSYGFISKNELIRVFLVKRALLCTFSE